MIPGAFFGGYDFGPTVWAAAAGTGIFATSLAFVLQVDRRVKSRQSG